MRNHLSAPVSSSDHLRGRLDAAMQLVVYGDYECPYTRRALIQVRAVRQELGDDFALVFRNFPLFGVKGYLDACADAAAAPVVEKCTGALAAADVFTASTAFWVMESIRLDLGYASQVHP